MTLKTLIEIKNQKDFQKSIQIAQVEIYLLPGIPQIHFLGLADQSIKESFYRIKAAFKSCGYQFPLSQQVVVNIEPQNIKKTSQGLELAVALGILHLTGQKVIASDFLSDGVIAGELHLDGRVKFTSDILRLKTNHSVQILSGINNHGVSYLENLRSEIVLVHKQVANFNIDRPLKGLKQSFTKREAEIIFLMATTELHTLLAGHAGAGKSFLAKHYSSFLNEDVNKLKQCFLNSEQNDLNSIWYPLIAPHHSVTPAAFLGGGVRLHQGEIEKVENGILLLDELLEFDSVILESLREPMTGEELRLARADRVKIVKPNFQVVATTNFCPCGKRIPDVEVYNCRFSVSRCKGYLQKLSGPLLDRFGLMMFFHSDDQERVILGEQILERIINFNKSARELNNCENSPGAQHFMQLKYKGISNRRKNCLVKAAQVYAVESGHQQIELEDIVKSEVYTLKPFLSLC